MKLTKVLLLVTIIAAYSGFSKCVECNDVGYVRIKEDCPLCSGKGKISPAYYGQNVGVTRWTVTESFIGNIKIGEWESEKRTKSYSWSKCPCCQAKKKILTIKECSCKKDIKELNKANYNRVMSKCKACKLEFKEELPTEDSFVWTKVMYVSKNNWTTQQNTLPKLLYQCIFDVWDNRGADATVDDCK